MNDLAIKTDIAERAAARIKELDEELKTFPKPAENNHGAPIYDQKHQARLNERSSLASYLKVKLPPDREPQIKARANQLMNEYRELAEQLEADGDWHGAQSWRMHAVLQSRKEAEREFGG